MKVFLLEKIEGVGESGDIVEVSEGYARNYLFPRGLAAAATEQRVKEAEHKKKSKAEAEKKELGELEKLAEDLDGKTVPISVEVGPDKQMFGAVTAKDIKAELEKAAGVSLKKGTVVLEEPIKELGETKVRLEFSHGLEAEIIVVVEEKMRDDENGEEKEKVK